MPLTLVKKVRAKQVGTITAGYYGPYYFNDADLQFLNALNRILLIAGAVSLGVCVLLGTYLARRRSKPISDVIAATGKIVEGNYSERVTFEENTAELIALSHSVNSLAASLESQEPLRKRLTADVAHELRTPLTTLLSTVETMLGGVWAADDTRLNSLREEIFRLNKLVDELSTLSKYESESLKPNTEVFDPGELCTQIAQNFEGIARQKGVSLTISGARRWCLPIGTRSVRCSSIFCTTR